MPRLVLVPAMGHKVGSLIQAMMNRIPPTRRVSHLSGLGMFYSTLHLHLKAPLQPYRPCIWDLTSKNPTRVNHLGSNPTDGTRPGAHRARARERGSRKGPGVPGLSGAAVLSAVPWRVLTHDVRRRLLPSGSFKGNASGDLRR